MEIRYIFPTEHFVQVNDVSFIPPIGHILEFRGYAQDELDDVKYRVVKTYTIVRHVSELMNSWPKSNHYVELEIYD